MTSTLPNGIYDLITDYIDYYGERIQILDRPPRSLKESHRILRSNRPCVFKNAAQSIPALQKWQSDEYMLDTVGRKTLVTTAITSNGLADSVSTLDDNEYFVEPLYLKLPFQQVMESFSCINSTTTSNRIQYLQAQNNNLPSEFPMLQQDIPMPDWAKDMFDEEPAATNLWIGDHRSTTSMHCDPFENLYLTVKGTKLFVLFPPHELACMHEKKYPCARLDDRLQTVPLPSANMVPWITVPTSPLLPSVNDPTFSTIKVKDAISPEILQRYPNLQHSHPHRIVLRAGEMLYLPSMWLHGVGQAGQSSSDPKCIAVNWWHDMDFAPGGVWSLNQLVRSMTLEL